MIGETISHYRIIAPLGRGGMGEVYLAEDTRLERKVAIKFIIEELESDRSSRRRFLTEAKAAAALDHPFVCKVFDADEHDGNPFIVMEYIEGQSLSDKLQSGPIPLDAALAMASEIAEAMESAHARGFMHRDLKPANIMLTRDGHVKIMDFGLAKRIRHANEDEQTAAETLTAATTILGTIAYMAPEQIKGASVDGRADIFSFGLILYEMLARVNPFKKDSALSTCAAILHDVPPPLSLYGTQIPRRVEQVIQRMLAKDLGERFASFLDVHEALAELRGESQADERKVSERHSLVKRLWLGAALIASMGGVAILGWWLYLHYFRSPHSALAFADNDWVLVTDVENQTGDSVFDKSLQTAITVGIQQSQYVYVFPQARVLETLQRMRKGNVEKLDEQLASEIAVREGIKALLVSSISQIGSGYLLSTRLVDPNTRLAVMTESIRASNKDKVLDGLDVLIKKVREGLGESLSNISAQSIALPKATTASLSALKTFAEGQRLMATDPSAGFNLMEESVKLDPEFALAQAALGMRYYMNGDGDRGEQHFTQAMKVVDRLTLREKLWINAVVEDWRGNRDGAIRSYETYLSQYADDNTAWFRLGWTNMIMGNYEKAVAAFNKAVELNPSDAASYVNLATIMNAEAANEKALVSYEKAFALQPQLLTGIFVNNEYGFLLVKMGRIPQAIETFQKMFAPIGPTEFAPDELKAVGHRSLALLDMYRGRYSAAAEQLKEAILLRKAVGNNLGEFRDHLFLATAYAAKGNQKALEAELSRAMSLERQLKLSPEFLGDYGKLYARLGKVKEAEFLLQRISSRLNDVAVVASIARSDRGSQSAFHLLKGEIALAKGKNEEAVESFELAVKLLDGAYNLESLAHGYFRQGKLDTAAEKYQQVVKQQQLGNWGQEQWFAAHLQLGKIFEQKGEPAKARDWYEKLNNLWRAGDPDIPALVDAKARLAKLSRN